MDAKLTIPPKVHTCFDFFPSQVMLGRTSCTQSLFSPCSNFPEMHRQMLMTGWDRRTSCTQSLFSPCSNFPEMHRRMLMTGWDRKGLLSRRTIDDAFVTGVPRAVGLSSEQNKHCRV